ncbi:hypothetical protein BJF85_22200 [Saccharomonospora sp. CUA-673]|uniref:hypothetical protein n=1 Tax=Saccharomonospora sp. CUA-673 TaxID=1904969 RepID=UPI0009613759|nr:hypothetical protein [Saccharomonospora sp. CUA-673]OLT42655.1 hypothetical protein BJF85_22200 [Saccharomonospora sp. CUA-673]
MNAETNGTELPPYRAVMVVDMKNFSGERGRDHARITENIPMVLENSFRACGCGHVWDDIRFSDTTGDGYVVGFDTRWTPFLLNPVLPALQLELERQNRVARGVAQPMRMRVSLTAGPMTDSGTNSISDGSGATRIEAHRMVDGDGVRAVLTDSGNATCVAAIVSEQVYRDVVMAGYSGEDPALYVPVDVAVKAYRGAAYLRVPTPSGDLLRRGLVPTKADADQEGLDPAGPHRDAATPQPRYVGVQEVQGSVGTVVTGEGNTVNSGGGNQFNGVEISGNGPTVLGTNHGSDTSGR